MNSRKKGMTLVAKQRTAGWLFLAPASIMIAVMSFYPMIRAFIISLQTGAGANMRFADPIFSNYKRILADKVFQQSIVNTFLYLIIQVPIMLIPVSYTHLDVYKRQLPDVLLLSYLLYLCWRK